MAPLEEVFSGRRVLVTGDTGFKGSWLAFWLHRMGAEVFGLALPPEGDRSHFATLGLDTLVDHVDGDIRDAAVVGRTFADARPEIVFHLAAQAILRRGYADPKRTFDTNVGGTVNLLEAVRTTPGVGAAVFITSDKCYRNKEWVWGYRENDELGGGDPYGASKAAAEIAFGAYRQSFFADGAPGVATARAGNVIGGGDWAEDRIVPDCMRCLERGDPIVLRNPQATRPWQHVLEPLHGYLTLAARLWHQPGAYAGSWNFGPPAATRSTVLQLVEEIVARWGSGEIRIDPPPDAPHEATLLRLDTDKAEQALGWRARWNLDRTLDEVVAWYRSVLGGAPPREVSVAQIDAYGATAAA